MPDRILIVKGRVDHKEGETKLIASEVSAFEAVAFKREVRLRIDATQAAAGLIRELAALIRDFPGESPVYLDCLTSQGPRVYALGAKFRVEPEADFYAEVKALLSEAAGSSSGPRARFRRSGSSAARVRRRLPRPAPRPARHGTRRRSRTRRSPGSSIRPPRPRTDHAAPARSSGALLIRRAGQPAVDRARPGLLVRLFSIKSPLTYLAVVAPSVFRQSRAPLPGATPNAHA